MPCKLLLLLGHIGVYSYRWWIYIYGAGDGIFTRGSQMNISSSSTKAEIIQGAQEYLATTDEQLKTLKGDRQALVVLLAVTATFALLF